MKSKILLGVLFFLTTALFAQNKTGLVGGPMLGNVELRNAVIWLEVSSAVKKVQLTYWKEGEKSATALSYKEELGKDFNPIRFEINGLDYNTTYNYSLVIDGKPVTLPYTTKFTTKDLWQWRKPAPDFSFLTGSCSYFNEPVYDRPGKPYGGDSSIFETMANTPAQLHFWLGDNWYYREVDYFTKWGLYYRASLTRSLPVMQKFYASMPQYAIWDDHDYGSNDANSSYILKEDARKLFMDYWSNPSYGENGKGIYTVVSYSDVDFFMLDDRYFRSADDMTDSINGEPNMNKQMYGQQQMRWLENALLTSKATFKVIITGSQVLNPYSPFDCVKHFPADYNYLMDMLQINKINGVLFLTGDRHHSEVIKLERENAYPLYDVTVSPYTSGTHKFSGPEKNNPARVLGIDEKQNFAKVSVSGKNNQRVMKFEFIGIKGEKLGEWTVGEKELKNK